MNVAPTQSATLKNGSRVFYRWIVVFLAVFAVAVTNGLSIGNMPISHCSLIDEFGWNRTTIATAGSLLLLARGLAGPLTGPLWDRYGPKRFMVIRRGGHWRRVGFRLFYQLGAASLPDALVDGRRVDFCGNGTGRISGFELVHHQAWRRDGYRDQRNQPERDHLSSDLNQADCELRLAMAMIIYAAFAFIIFAPLMYFFIKNRLDECGASADPDESDWFLRRRRLISGVTVTTKLVLVDLFGLRSVGKLLGVMTGVEAIFGSGGTLLTGRLFDKTGSYEAAFKVMAVCSIASVILMAMLGRRPLAWSLRPAEK